MNIIENPLLNPLSIIDEGGPYYVYETYSWKEGLTLPVGSILIAALTSMIIALMIGIRKKDCIAILVTNVMTKTVATALIKILDSIMYNICYMSGEWEKEYIITIIILLIPIIIEGVIYRKILKYNKHNGITVSLICNVGIILLVFLLFFLTHVKHFMKLFDFATQSENNIIFKRIIRE